MKRRSGAMWLAGTCLAVLGGQAKAQDTGPAESAVQASAADANVPAAQAPGDDNEAIIVTAQKRSQRLIDVPQSVSVVSGDALETAHAERLSDYFTRLPSANIVESQAGESRIVLRGVNTGGAGATVATYVDETPFGSATSLANGAILALDIDPFDLDRVEVLRGPQGTLYGANSLGGLVKYVTVAPNPKGFDGAASIGIEDVAHGDTGWTGRAAANVPLGNSAAFRISGFYRDELGYIDDPVLGHDINDGKSYGGRFSFLAKPTDRLQIRASILLQNIRSNGTNSVDVDPVTLEPVIGRLQHQRVLVEPNDIDYRIYNGTIDYDFGGVSLVSATSYGTLDQTQIQDATGVYGPLLTGALGLPLGAGIDQGMTQRRFTQEVRLASNGGGAIDWTIGGFYTRERNRLSQNLFGVDFASGDRIDDLDGLVVISLPSKYREVAGFANATWHVTSAFDLTGGARYSHNRQTVVQNTDGLLAGGATTFDGSSSDNVFTYSIAPSYKIGERTRVYARVAKGYRPGGPNVVSPLAPSTVPRSFGPDTTTNYEVGIKSETADHLLSFELSGFVIDWNNIQLIANVENFGVNTNGGKAKSEGIELSVAAHPIPALSLYASGAYVDAHLTRDAPDIVGGERGDRLPYNAKFSSTLGAELEQPVGSNMTARAGLSWHYTGSRRSDFDTDFGQRKLGSFSQIDAHAGVDFGRFRVDAFARNLTDARGIVNLGGSGTAQDGNVAASVVRPRSFGLTLGARY